MRFLHDICRHSDFPRRLAFNVELCITSLRWHSSMSMDTFHVLYEAWCLLYDGIASKKLVREGFLDE